MTQNTKRKLKRIDWDITQRILTLLYYNGKGKKTNIAMKCNLNYEQLTLYLEWLGLVDFIKREIAEDGFEEVGLSDLGIDFYKKKLMDDNLKLKAISTFGS